MKQKMLVALLAAVVPLIGNGLTVAIWLPLLDFSPGSYGRPLIAPGLVNGAALLTFLVGIPLGAMLLSRGHRLAGWLCISFSCTPFFVGRLTFAIISAARDLHWAD